MHTLNKELYLCVLYTFCIWGNLCENDTWINHRIIYIAPDSSSSQVDCPVEQCHSLLNVLRNQSHYFESNTTLELLPGTYYVTEKVGHVVIANVNQFKIKGSLQFKGDAIIICQPDAILGFTFIQSRNVEISNIQISNCSAIMNSEINGSLLSAIDTFNNLHNIDVFLEYNFTTCRSMQEHHVNTLCYIFLASIDDTEIFIHQTAILHSRGVGVFGLGSRHLSMSETTLAYNKVNCINFIIGYTNTSFSVTRSKIMYGNAEDQCRPNLASGMNLFIRPKTQFHSTNLTENRFKNNKGCLGNLYMDVGTRHPFEIYSSRSVNFRFLLSDTISIQESGGLAISVQFSIYKYTRRSILSNYNIDFSNVLNISNVYVKGGCIAINNSFIHTWPKFRDITAGLNVISDFKMNNVTVFESKCSTALELEREYIAPSRESSISLEMSDLTIFKSCHNIISLKENGFLTLTGNTSFVSNKGSVLVLGGGVVLKDFTYISGNIAQSHDSVIYINESGQVTLFLGEHIFINNTGREGGALYVHKGSTLYIYGKVMFIGNSADSGGAITLKGPPHKTLQLHGEISFINNAGQRGGAISVDAPGAIIEITWKTLIFIGNSADDGGAVSVRGNSEESCKILFQGELSFINNTGRQGGAISVHEAVVAIYKKTSFIGNTADNGGAIILGGHSYLSVNEVTFRKNSAKKYGGAIFVEDDSWLNTQPICFIAYAFMSSRVEFEYNTAGIAGKVLFGGMIDTCVTLSNFNLTDILEFNSENSVSSNPYQVCLCTNSTINKWTTDVDIQVFPGQIFNIEVATVGQRHGVAPASVRVKPDFDNMINELQKIQDTNKYTCTNVSYTVRSSNRQETLKLYVDQRDTVLLQNKIISLIETNKLNLHVFLLDCPLGFEFDHKQNICICHHQLVQQGIQCNFTSYTVNRNEHQWIGVSDTNETIAIHQHCPYDYCNSNVLSFNLSSPDDQCNYNRSGTLCGACQPGLSLVLGTSKCKKCSNLWLLLTIVFALAGIALVAVLMLLNLTVTTGTINGLIFYANVVRANNAVFFPGNKSTTSFLSWFIAWLNLDLGIETCFYNGLDAYAKTWLQFAFPFYIWLLVALIIVSSKYSRRIAKICRKNAVQVLATLFILSYAKLLRVSITIFQPTHLAEVNKVWNYNGNIIYLGKQHAPLMIVGLLFFVMFFIPYTVILFGIQWFQRYSQYRVFSWVNKFKPLFDAYTGPYKDNHRYWTGLLLLARIGLFIVFSANVTGDPFTNLLAIIIVIIFLFAYLALFAGVYKTWLLNVLEYVFLLNLIVLSLVVFYTTLTNGPIYTVTQASIGTALTIAIGIAIYAILKTLKINVKLRDLYAHVCRIRETSQNVQNMRQDVTLTNYNVTYSTVELGESLLEYDN